MNKQWVDTLWAWGDNPWISVAPLSWVALFTCLLSGGIIGFERQWQGKPIGIRTSVLICMGTYVFTAMSHSMMTTATDPTRVVGQVITGIGFLGAGVMLTRHGMVVGATSAASIWMLAAIGVVIATGPALLGVKLALLSVTILVGVNYVEGRFAWLQHGMHQRPATDSDGEPRHERTRPQKSPGKKL